MNFGPDSSSSITESELYGLSKDAFRQILEKRRSNDFVRKKEFSQLRKIMRSRAHPSLGTYIDESKEQSIFLNSQPANYENRKETMRKIDQIEAHMSFIFTSKNDSKLVSKVQPGQALEEFKINDSMVFPLSITMPACPTDIAVTLPFIFLDDFGGESFQKTEILDISV